jgi:nitroimidazol reductase NimA-like FMN-containing flavoprotein (pyridoxamine 5'-phosphate oxidase superfamily)
MDLHPEDGRQHDLDPGDCLLLLAMQEVGRLIVSGAPPKVRPVNFVVVDGRIYLRTGTALPAEEVVFEVDQIDTTEHQGWSVIARGHVREVAADDVPRDAQDRLVTWAPGERPVWSVIDIHAITGSWVRAGRTRRWPEARGYL